MLLKMSKQVWDIICAWLTHSSAQPLLSDGIACLFNLVLPGLAGLALGQFSGSAYGLQVNWKH